MNPRVQAAHSRRILALWLITFVGVAIHLGVCARDLPSQTGSGAPPAGMPWAAGSANAHRAADMADMADAASADVLPADAHWASDADRPGEQPAPDEQHRHVLSYGPGGRLSPVHQRTSRSLPAGVAAGWLLVAASTGERRAAGVRAPVWRRRHATRCRAGARLLIRLCTART